MEPDLTDEEIRAVRKLLAERRTRARRNTIAGELARVAHGIADRHERREREQGPGAR